MIFDDLPLETDLLNELCHFKLEIAMVRQLAAGVVLLAGLTSPAAAQSPDFLFGKPKGTVAVRSGWLFARAGSDLFTFVQDQLTVDKNDFNAPAMAFDVDVPVKGRISVIAG